MKKIGLSMILAALVFAPSVQASTGVHTWHVVSVKSGSWSGRLQAISEKTEFVKPDMSAVSTFEMTPSSPLKFGAIFDSQDDFDVAYTLTLTQKSITAFVNKTCVFVVTAKGPADPDVRYFSYHGAVCGTTTVPGVGEDFYAE